MRSRVASLALTFAVIGGCNAIFGVDELSFAPPSGGGSSTTATGGGGGGGGMGGQGGGEPLPYCQQAVSLEGPAVDRFVTFNGPQADVPRAIAVDRLGQPVVGIDLDGEIVLAGDNIISQGATDALVVKLDNDGSPLWNNVFTGSGEQRISDIAIAPDGTVYVVGEYDGDTSVEATDLTPSAEPACFVAALDGDSGAVMFAHALIATECAFPHLAVANGGNVVVAGEYSGALLLNAVNVLNAGVGASGFVVRFSDAGALVDATAIDGNGSERVLDIAITPDNGEAIVGLYNSDGLSIAGDDLPWTGAQDAFIAKHTGSTTWAQGISAAGNQTAEWVGAREDGAVVAGIDYVGNFTLGGDTFVSNTSNILVAAFDADGGVLWANDYGGGAPGLGMAGMAIGFDDRSYEVGHFGGTLQVQSFGPFANAQPGSDAFVAARDALGSVRWVMHASGGGDVQVNAVTTDCRGFAWIAGSYEQSLDFNGASAQGELEPDVFVARLLR
jgi:hypothetical protein